MNAQLSSGSRASPCLQRRSGVDFIDLLYMFCIFCYVVIVLEQTEQTGGAGR